MPTLILAAGSGKGICGTHPLHSVGAIAPGEMCQMSRADTQNETHARTTKLDIRELVGQLVSHLGSTLVATLANVKDRKLPYKWAHADGPQPRADSYARLLVAHRVWTDISMAESDGVARAWFIGANPRLGEMSPVFAIREGRDQEVLAAARAFLDGTDD